MENNSLLNKAARLDDWSWDYLPSLVPTKYFRLRQILSDGYYLRQWPEIVGVARVVIFILGLAISFGHIGWQTIFTESLLLVCGVVIVGIISAELGVTFLTAFIIGNLLDIILHARWGAYYGFNYGILAEPIIFSVLAYISVLVPLLCKQLLASVKSIPKFLGGVSEDACFIGLHAAIAGALVYFWAQSAPMLIRPIFTWNNSQPTVIAMTALQVQIQVLVACAVIAGGLRQYFQNKLAHHPEQARFPLVTNQKINEPSAKPNRFGLTKRVYISIVSAYLLAGLYTQWLEAIVFCAALFLLPILASKIDKAIPATFKNNVLKIPLLFRTAAAMVVFYFVAQFILNTFWSNFISWSGSGTLWGLTGTFTPILIIFILGYLFWMVLNPETENYAQT